MGWIQLAVLAIQLIIKIWDAVKESNDEIRKQKTQVVQNNARAIVDRDASRIVSNFDELRRMRGV